MLVLSLLCVIVGLSLALLAIVTDCRDAKTIAENAVWKADKGADACREIRRSLVNLHGEIADLRESFTSVVVKDDEWRRGIASAFHSGAFTGHTDPDMAE